MSIQIVNNSKINNEKKNYDLFNVILQNFIKVPKITMVSYKTTVLKNHSEYAGKKLFLTTKLKGRLFYNKQEDYYLELEFNNDGQLIVHKISKKLKRTAFNYSLRKIGEEFLEFKDPTVNKMLNYLVLPEMEVERIFNNLRYKYLNSIYLSNFENPQKFLNSKYNQAFQALAGMYVYQGNINDRKDNDDLWKSIGFKEIARIKNNFIMEKKDMKFIIRYIYNLIVDNFNKIYSELIAIKPGFHEIWIHGDYFENKYNKPPRNPLKEREREKIFRRLRGLGNLSDLIFKAMPNDLKRWDKYLTYSSCNITEGPFVFRKNVSISYYDEIKNINSRKDIPALKKSFEILDYRQSNLTSREKLRLFLENTNTKRFCGFF